MGNIDFAISKRRTAWHLLNNYIVDRDVRSRLVVRLGFGNDEETVDGPGDGKLELHGEGEVASGNSLVWRRRILVNRGIWVSRSSIVSN